ncbi:MAG: hypothetical protein MJ126_00605 [Lachnospiraceae bacterium]|nr:hypothetical protein [Lachnospiraceae bacterium]
MKSRFDFNNDDKNTNQKKNSNSKNNNTQKKNSNHKNSKEINKQNTKVSNKRTSVSNNSPKKSNIVLFPKTSKFSFNIFIYLVFALVLIYLVFCIYKFVNSKNISTYQVKEGALTEQNTYTGIILRDEEIFESGSSGYYNYYLKEGEKASKTDLVYSIDGSGKIKDMMINQTEDATTLTQDDLTEIKSEIVKFSKKYDNSDFSDVYDFKDDLGSISLKMSNLFILDKISTLSLSGTNVNKYYCGARADQEASGKIETGYVVYYYDGFENLNPEDINSSYFTDDIDYEKHMVSNNEIVDKGDFAYKLITSNSWKIIFPISEEQAKEFNNKEIKVRFSKNQETLIGRFTTIDVISAKKNASIEQMGVVTFNNSVADFINNRYVDFEIAINENNGYKVPRSSIAEKEFLLIPKDIGFDFNSTTNKVSIKLDKYLDDGSKVYVTTELNVYDIDDFYYYVDNFVISKDTYVFGNDEITSEKITKSGTLTGVYKINQGYADFKKIKILYENDEYCIIDPSTTTLKPYDYIALNAKKVKDDEYIYN